MIADLWFRFLARGNSACRCVTSLWGCPSVGLTARCCLTLLSSSLSSVASDFSRVSSEVWLDVGSMFKLGLDVKAASYFGVAPSFKEARFSSREQREQRAGVRFLDGLTSGRPPALFQWKGSCRRSSAYTAHFPCRKSICLVILSHEENILADFYLCYNHTLWC